MDLDFEQPIVEIEKQIDELSKLNKDPEVQFDTEIGELQAKLAALEKRIYGRLTPWQTVLVARHNDRPLFQDYVSGMMDEFIELHGDRRYGDDRAMVGGFATLDGHRIMLLGTEKGKSVEQRVETNFGMSNPEGYRKALRLMGLAQKYKLPVVCLVDTPAAFPGMEAEERGQAEAIARNLTEMASLEVPLIVVITGEGGSGGALGIAVGDVVMMLSYAIYSVIPPEGCATILWKDASKAAEAAAALKLTAASLLDMGIIDEIIPEPPGGAHRHPQGAIAATRQAVVAQLDKLQSLSSKKLTDRRMEKYARIGKFDGRKYADH